MFSSNEKKIRYGVVAAGHISQFAFMPGVAHTGNSVMMAVVTEDAEKAAFLAKKYDIQHTYNYDQYDEMIKAGVVDAVYIATPNDQHVTFTVRALKAGIHVLLEKPMAASEAQCKEILDAADASDAKLMIAYRLHSEPATLSVLQAVREGKIGKLIAFSSVFTQMVDPENHRAKDGFWAGPVADMGPYPINAVRNIFGAEPIEVIARGQRSGRLQSDFDDTVTVILKFPKGELAQFTVSYAAPKSDGYQITGGNGGIVVEPGFTYGKPIIVTTTVDGKEHKEKFGATDHFGGELKYFSDCILNDQEPEPDGEEGLCDVRVVAAIEKALQTGQPQALAPYTRARRPSMDQVENLHAVRPPSDKEMKNVRSPTVK